MTQEELQIRIDRVQSKINKINARIEKWTNKKNIGSFIKDYGPYYSLDAAELKSITSIEDFVDKAYNKEKTYNPEVTKEEIKSKTDRNYNTFLAECDNEVRRANWDLEEANKTLAKYQNALAKLNDFDSAEKIPAIWEFLQNWKREANIYYHQEMERLEEIKEWEHEQFEKYANKPEFRKEWKEAYAEYERRLATVDSNAKRFASYNDTHREPEIEKFLNQQVRLRYEKLVNDVLEITGPILDATALHISPRGELNGIVIGEDGKAKVETILAGGYNQDRIVNVKRGQILHYRCLIHEIH